MGGFGLGNHVADQHAGDTEDSMIARFTFTEGGDGRYAVTKAEVIPTRIDLSGPAVTLVNTAAHRDAEDSFYRRVVDVLNHRGAAAQGLIISDQ